MTEIQVQVDAEAINRMVSQAVLDSAIGDQLRSAVDGALRDFTLRQAIEKCVKSTVAKIINELLQGEHGEELREAVRQVLSSGIVSDLATKSFESWLEDRGVR